jgi:DNA polymerase-3 subunit gamma/tau
LKLVEEPPPHVKFVFATTEPDKVIGTIRSRTHHYPFRLVPPRTLSDYLARICAQEGVAAEPGVIGLVVRAGAGSVRDALSVLDQLLGAAGPDGIQYAQASALLGYTPDSLLDEYVDALAAGDAHGVFATVDKVVEAGQDPRRFAEDLLRRLRDLIIVATVDDAFASGLIDVPEDQAGRYQVQAKGLGPGELTRAAEVLAAGLTAMRGTTAPRLQLELMCARMLLPGADVADRGIHARLDRLERRLDMAPVSDEMTGPIAPKATSPAQAGAPAPTPSPAPSAAPPRRPPEPMAMPRAAVRPDAPPPAPTAPAAPPAPPAPAAPPVKLGAIDVADIRAHWPRILDEVKRRRKFTWFAVQQAQVTELSGNVLWLTFSQPGARAGFAGRGEEDVHQVIVDLLGADLVVRARAEDDPAPGREDSRPIPVAPPEPPADDIRPDDQVVPATAVDQEAEALVRQVLDAELVAED